MTGAVGHPLVGAVEGQPVGRVVVLAQGAAQRHQAVAHQAVGHAAALPGGGGGHRVAGHAGGQGQRLAAVLGVGKAVVRGGVVAYDSGAISLDTA